MDVAQRNLNNAVAVSLRRANSHLQMSSKVVDNLVRLSIVHGENVYYYRGELTNLVAFVGGNLTLIKFYCARNPCVETSGFLTVLFRF